MTGGRNAALGKLMAHADKLACENQKALADQRRAAALAKPCLILRNRAFKPPINCSSSRRFGTWPPTRASTDSGLAGDGAPDILINNNKKLIIKRLTFRKNKPKFEKINLNGT
jgi:hypothetical protein